MPFKKDAVIAKTNWNIFEPFERKLFQELQSFEAQVIPYHKYRVHSKLAVKRWKRQSI